MTRIAPAFLAAGVLAAARAQSPSFPSPQFALPSAGSDLTVDDVDRDGELDVLAACPASDAVAVLRGGPSAMFAIAAQSLPTHDVPLAIELGDVDGDGVRDLVVACAGPFGGQGSLDVLRGRVRGGFRAAEPNLCDFAPNSLSLGDVDGDGDLDALAGDDTFAATRALVFLGDGHGAFAAPSVLPTAAKPRGLRLLDVDADGELDVVGHAGALFVRLGVGDGSFGGAIPSPLSFFPNAIEYADLTGDQLPDVILASSFLSGASFVGELRVHANNGDGTFALSSVHAIAAHARDIAVADLDADGADDVCVGHLPPTQSLAGVAFLRRYAGGLEDAVEIATPGECVDLALADLEHDGDLDLLTATQSGRGAIGVRRALAPVVFDSTCVLSPVATQPTGIAAGDADGDGALDLAAILSNGSVEVVRGAGDGTFAACARVNAPDLVFWESLALADFNGDGRDDLVLVGADDTPVFDGRIDTWLATPQCSFVASESFTRGLGAHAIACKDLDGDSRIDLAVAYLGSPFVSVFHGRANGTFEPWVDVPFGSAGEGANDVEVADVDGDGRNDLVVALRSSYVAVALREPSASFAPAARFALSSVPSAVAVGRLDLDGALDVAASLYDTQSVEVLRGAGDGSFASVKVLAIREFVHDLAIADVNLNQRADIVVGAFDGSSAWVITGDGAFGFDPPRGFGAGFGPGFLTLGDFDSNGRVDLATANVGADSLGVLLHR